MGRIIGISGKKGVGKSTLSRNLQTAFPYAVVRPFAQPLKELCINVLGLDSEAVYGTDEDKKALTDIRQCNMPHWRCPDSRCQYTTGYRYCPHCAKTLAVREVLQQVGTEVFRSMKKTCWIDSMLRDAAKHPSPTIVIVDDCRFPDEAEAIRAAGGKVIRLDRPSDSVIVEHISECALDNWPHFDVTVNVVGKSPAGVLFSVLTELKW